MNCGVTGQELLGRLTPLLPKIAGLSAAADQARDTPAETIRALADADLFRLYQPSRWGGFEADPRVFFMLQNALAERCPSTAWVYGVLCVQSFLVSRFDPLAQEDVWGADPRALIGSAATPGGTATECDGGFRISGRWSFSSGISHAKWALLGARLPGPPVAGPPASTVFLVPREDYEIVDVWNSFGLRGTGSNDVVANDIFVPRHRVRTLDMGILNLLPAELPGPALYRMPWLYIFSCSISNMGVGVARAALQGFLEITRSRVSLLTGKVARDDPAVQQAAGRLAAEIDTAAAMFDRHVTKLLECDAANSKLSMPEAVLIRAQLTGTLRKLTALVDDLMVLHGAQATEANSPVTRAWLDLSAARAHLGNDPTMATSMLGSMLIGQQAG